jgi:hypothetical protein
MPTGYTYAIKDGISFKKFVMGCARAFGSCVTMRDDSSDQEIPEEFPVSTYHLERLEEASKKLLEFKKLTSEDYNKKAEEEFKDKLASYQEAVKKKVLLEDQYLVMLDKVKKWNVPSADHVKLKNFMIQQITDSIKYDCYSPEKPVPTTGTEWANKELKQILRDLDYHKAEYQEEVDRVASRNKWLKQLRESLAGEE